MKANSNSEIIEEDLRALKNYVINHYFRNTKINATWTQGRKYDIKWEYFELETVFKVGWTAVVFYCTRQCWYLNYITYDWLRKVITVLCSIWLSFVFFVCFLLVCVACVALGVFWVRDWFQSRMNSCRILLCPPAQIPQLHNLWLTKKGHHIVMLCLLFFFLAWYIIRENE